jgi:hypothetical protein
VVGISARTADGAWLGEVTGRITPA